jgi:hypothetical protein
MPGDDGRVLRLQNALTALDEPTAARVRPALARLREQGGPGAPSPAVVDAFLSHDLPRGGFGDDRDQHEVAWALGDVFDRSGLAQQAAICRSPATHERLAVARWVQSFTGVGPDFWQPALSALRSRRAVPPRAALSLSSAHALLQAVGEGLVLTPSGQLPPATVQALDDRFRWTEEFPWMRVTQESDIAPLHFLRAHLSAQRLLVEDGALLIRSALGVRCTSDTGRLWRAVVDPSPRWSQEFDRDALGVMAASVLRSADFTLGRIAEEMARVLEARWRPVSPAHRGSVFDGAAAVAQGWYQLGVPLGWWDTGRGPADRRPNPFGRAAAVTVFASVTRPPTSGLDP